MNEKYFVEGRERMEEYGGRTIRRWVKWRAEGETAWSAYFCGGQGRLGIALPALLLKTSTCHGREFLCVDLVFELNR